MNTILLWRRLGSARNISLIAGLIFLLVAVFMQPINMRKQVQQLQLTFDISQSMYVEDALYDGAQGSRLNISKRAALGLLRGLPCGSKLGWSVFSGARVMTLITPLEVCEHYDGLVSSLESIDGRLRWVNASSVGKGLHQSLRAAEKIADATSVLFFTDGHEAPPLRENSRGMPAVDADGVKGLLVGVGGVSPARIPKLNKFGEFEGYWSAEDVIQRRDAVAGTSHEELSSLQEAHLKKLARLSQLQYHKLESTKSLIQVINKVVPGNPQSVATDFRWLPAGSALLLLLWRFRLELPGKRRRCNARHPEIHL